MFHTALLLLHTLIWWIILFTGLWAVFRTWRGCLDHLAWTRRERLAGLLFSSALNAQLLIGLVLYSQSPIAHDFGAGTAAPADRPAAIFFGLIHPLVMFTAVALGQVGFSASKRLGEDRRKYRLAAICYTAALALLLSAVPWQFLGHGWTLMP